MLGRNGNVAYVRYDSQGRIVPGGPIISPYRPKVGFWQPVSNVIGTSVTSNASRAFVRIDAYGRVVPSSLLILSQAPSSADSGTYFLEIKATYRPQVIPTTTTSTSTSTSTSTTTSTSSTTTSTSSTTSTTSSSTSTTSTSTTIAPTTTSTTTSTPTYAVGQAALGGIIAYILQPGDPGYIAGEQHGLVATVSDITNVFNTLTWGCIGIDISGTSSALGTGAANTNLIVVNCSDSTFAAKSCADLVQGGYSDWYLPSLDELTKLQQNKDLIGNFDQDGRLYWSSSQGTANPPYDGFAIQFTTGDIYGSGKSNGAQVRPVRSF